jgi:hypothetical protein
MMIRAERLTVLLEEPAFTACLDLSPGVILDRLVAPVARALNA